MRSATLRSFLALLLIGVLLPLGASASAAETGPLHSISGVVRSDTGGPIAGVSVNALSNTGGGSPLFAVTADDGTYTIAGVPAGQYELHFFDHQWRPGSYVPVNHTGRELYTPSTGPEEPITVNDTGVPPVDVTMRLGGRISGTLTAGGGVMPVLCVGITDSTEMVTLAFHVRDDGTYLLPGVPEGVWFVHFRDCVSTSRVVPEYFENAASVDGATAVTISPGGERTGLDADLELLGPGTEPLAQTQSATGFTTVDPETGQVTLAMPTGARSAVTLAATAECAGGSTPTSVRLTLGEKAFDPEPDSAYTFVIGVDDVESGDLVLVADCGGEEPESVTLGRIVLYDPSGIVTDAETGAPVVGATVELYEVPTWRPEGTEGWEGDTCETNDTKDPDAAWSQPAPTAGGVRVDPSTDRISPNVNPFITDSVGYYGWDVAEGCWYVVVSKDGYRTLVSPVVGVPPAVTDLDLELVPLDAGPVEVTIDVRPGSDRDVLSGKAVQVAILSSDGFDAPGDVDRASLRFGASGDEDSLVRDRNGQARCSNTDANGDSVADLVCRFDIEAMGAPAGPSTVWLTGQVSSGRKIEGMATVERRTRGKR